MLGVVMLRLSLYLHVLLVWRWCRHVLLLPLRHVLRSLRHEPHRGAS